LPAFLLSKSFYSESIGTPQHSAEDFAFVFKSFATCFGIPLRKPTTRHSQLITAAK
jgi:hypothetical protein